MGSCLLNFLLVRIKLLIWWDFCRFFNTLLEQLLKFLLNIQVRSIEFGVKIVHVFSFQKNLNDPKWRSNYQAF